MKNIEINARITKVEYKSTSCYGNQKFRVWFEQLNETGEVVDAFYSETANNAACAYGINNPGLKKHAKIKYHETKIGNLIITHCSEK